MNAYKTKMHQRFPHGFFMNPFKLAEYALSLSLPPSLCVSHTVCVSWCVCACVFVCLCASMRTIAKRQNHLSHAFFIVILCILLPKEKDWKCSYQSLHVDKRILLCVCHGDCFYTMIYIYVCMYHTLCVVYHMIYIIYCSDTF